jgi:hypothetical protein
MSRLGSNSNLHNMKLVIGWHPTGRIIPSAHVPRCVASLDFSRSLPLASFSLCAPASLFQPDILDYSVSAQCALSLPPRLPASDS